jgi:DNA polymerase III delta prime subunit
LLKLSEIFNVTIDFLLDKDAIIVDEPKITLHQQYANKITETLENEGLEYTEDTLNEIINFSKYILSKKKQDG